MTLYRSLRDEMMAGGSTDDRPESESPGRGRGLLTAAIIVGLLVWLGVSNPWSLVIVLGLLVSVFLHEVGHFVTAGWAGMKRTQFFMGFGPRVWSFHRDGVEYGVRALPLGAFVRIVGMNNLDPVDSGDEDVAYYSKPYRWRLLVITAGSLMHFLIAVALLFTTYVAGGRYQETGRAEVMAVSEDTPAEAAGLLPGDVVVRIDDIDVTSSDVLRNYIRSLEAGDDITLVWNRDGSEYTAGLTLEAAAAGSTAGAEDSTRPGFVGVATNSYGRDRLGPVEATGRIVGDLADGFWQTVKGIGTVANPLNQWDQLTNEEADPAKRPTTVVGVTMVAGDIGERFGFWAVLEVLASINVFVGLFNLLPLLPFDGGHAAIATYERLRSRRGRPYRADVEKMWPVTVAVLTLLLLLTFTGLYLDITRPF